jgi:hypothetical protein
MFDDEAGSDDEEEPRPGSPEPDADIAGGWGKGRGGGIWRYCTEKINKSGVASFIETCISSRRYQRSKIREKETMGRV